MLLLDWQFGRHMKVDIVSKLMDAKHAVLSVLFKFITIIASCYLRRCEFICPLQDKVFK